MARGRAVSAIVISVFTGVFISLCEAVMKSRPHWDWWLFGPLAFFQSYLFWRIIHASENLVSAFVFFALTTASMRVVLSLAMHLPVGPGSWVALVLMLVASVCRQWSP